MSNFDERVGDQMKTTGRRAPVGYAKTYRSELSRFGILTLVVLESHVEISC